MRRNLSRSRLVSLLGDWAFMDSEVSRQDWAQRLSLWLGPFDAITLNAAHQSIKAAAAEQPSHTRQPRSFTLDEEFRRVREGLVKAIAAPDLSRSNEMRINRSALKPEQVGEVVCEYAPYRQRYLEQQRRMEWKIDPLRIHCRQVLSQTNAKLRQLAELDAVLEQSLGAREKTLLSKVPVLLERRFEHLKKSHGDGLKLPQQQDASANWQQSGGWLNVFDKDFHGLLRAELDFRLEPVVGLIEAFSNEA